MFNYFGKWATLFAIAVLIAAFVVAVPVSAHTPAPTSSLVNEFVQQTDGGFGYQMLRPDNWYPLHLGDARVFFPQDTLGEDGKAKADRVVLSVVNLQRLSTILDESVQIATLLQFEDNPTLLGWAGIVEQEWQKMGIPFEQLNILPNAVIYALTPASDQVHLVGYVVDGNVPLVVSMEGYGSFGSLETLITFGLVADFEVMVASTRAFNGDAETINPPLIEPEIGPAPPVPSPVSDFHDHSHSADDVSVQWVERSTVEDDAWGYHCHGSTCGYDYWVQLLARWEGSASEVQRMYESMWYRHSDLSGEWLYRAHVTDDSTWCQYVPSQYINRGISKQTSGSQYQVTDDYWPYYSNGSIDSQTDHGMVYGGGAVTYCTPQDPPPFY